MNEISNLKKLGLAALASVGALALTAGTGLCRGRAEARYRRHGLDAHVHAPWC